MVPNHRRHVAVWLVAAVLSALVLYFTGSVRAVDPGAVKPPLVEHVPSERSYLNETAPASFDVRLRVMIGDVTQAYVDFGGERTPMALLAKTDDSRFFGATVKTAAVLIRYHFELCDGKRTWWAGPDGVFATPDAGKPFEYACGSGGYFQTPEWVRTAVFYQIFPDRFANGNPANDPTPVEKWGGEPSFDNFFGGDLAGIRNHVAYLRNLGITAVYFNPLFAAPSNHKYDTVDYMTIDPHFGTNGEFAYLVTALHDAGIRVVIDFVFNHTGDRFWAFQDAARNGETSPYAGWYYFKGFPVRRAPVPNYETWGGHAHLPKLNVENPAVKAYLFDVTEYWLGLGVDGVRLDAAGEVSPAFWKEFRRLVKSTRQDAFIMGELWNDASPWLQGDQLDAVMNYPFRQAVLDFFIHQRKSVTDFDAALARQRMAYPDVVNAVQLNLLGSHDTVRVLTQAAGNVSSVKLAVLFQMTYPGAPCVYYGDEVGVEGGRDPGCRRTFPWNTGEQNQELLAWYRKLIGLRNGHRALQSGSFDTALIDDENSIYGYVRASSGGDERALVVINRGRDPQRVVVDVSRLLAPASLTDALSGRSLPVTGGRLRVLLEARSAMVFVWKTR